MPYYTPVEQVLGVKLTPFLLTDELQADRKVDVDGLITAGKIEWQNPNARDCGLGDGIDYIWLNIPEEGEYFVAVDPRTNLVWIT